MIPQQSQIRGEDAMNIQMQIAGLGVLVLLLCFYLRRKSVGLYTEVFFKWTMIVTLINISLDILSVIMITYQDVVPVWLCTIVCKLYLCALISTGCLGLLYICQDIYKGRDSRVSFCIFTGLAVVGDIIVLALPIHNYHEGRVEYSYGPSVLCTYIFCVSFIILTLVMALINRHRMSRERVTAVVQWILVWMAAAVIQFFNNQWLLVGYASSLGMMILFFKLENPQASLDRETGAYNSHIFLKYMKQLYDKGQPFAVLIINLEEHRRREAYYDDDKMVNIVDFLEDHVGDKVFKSVEQELAIIFDDSSELEQSLSIIQGRFHQSWDGVYYDPVYVTIYDSRLAASAQEIYRLLRYYKQHMEHMDEHKVIHIDEDRIRERREYLEMEKVLTDALDEDRVEVFYQPIYSIERGIFASAEALARIRAEDGSIVPPGLFIPVAEETGLIEQLGEVVFEKVCQMIQREKIWKKGVEFIEVNLSVRQCESHKLAPNYIRIMEEYGVDPSRINMEVTESVSIQMRQTLLRNMESLIGYGVAFSLDDFGNGEANLNYIVDMPVQIVKFDRDMTRAYFEKEKGKFVMESATRMILDMGLQIVSEGVETKEQLEGMERLGVQYIQGFYFSRPLPEEDFIKFIEDKNKQDDLTFLD